MTPNEKTAPRANGGAASSSALTGSDTNQQGKDTGTVGDPLAALTVGEARDLAAMYANAGIPVFPIGLSANPSGGIDKKPLTRHGFKNATTDTRIVDKMFDRANPKQGQMVGVGIHPGPAGYVIIDVDTKNGATGFEDLKRLSDELGALPENTMRVDTASGGWHYWLKRPPGVTHIDNRKLAPGLDIRADAGYVVAPGVKTPWGEWKRDQTTARATATPVMPANWAGAIILTQDDNTRSPIPDVLTPGNRHDKLMRLASSMRGHGANSDEIYGALTVMNDQRCNPPKPDKDIRALADDIANRYDPNPEPTVKPAETPLLPFETLSEMIRRVEAAGERKYLIRGVWPADAYGVHGAEMKAQKTWNGLDLAVSVASGTPWLNHFPIDTPGPVIVFIGEGGAGSIVRRINAICANRDLKPEDLPITICARAPKIRDAGHMQAFTDKVEELKPRLVIIDPFYLSAAGGKTGDVYAMGELLERPQHICETHGTALMVITHYNRNKSQTGVTSRITGAGPAEWGRILIGADVKSRTTDPETKQTTVVTALDVIGGEVPDLEWRIKRQIVADDPDVLSSPLHYSVEVIEADGYTDGDDDMPPARRKLLEAVHAVGTDGATGRELVDWIADKYGHGLYRTTVSAHLNALAEIGEIDSITEPGRSTIWFPKGVSSGVATTGRRHPTTGDTGGVSSPSSSPRGRRHPDTPKQGVAYTRQFTGHKRAAPGSVRRMSPGDRLLFIDVGGTSKRTHIAVLDVWNYPQVWYLVCKHTNLRWFQTTDHQAVTNNPTKKLCVVCDHRTRHIEPELVRPR